MHANYFMHKIRLKPIFYLLLFLSGCARIPKSDLAHRSEFISLDRSLESAYAREFFEEGGWPTDAWWEMFGDPQLNTIVERGLIL